MDQELYQKISDFLDQKLSEPEVRQFSAQMAEDADLALAVKMVQLEREVAGELFDQELEAQMAAWDAEASATNHTRPDAENGVVSSTLPSESTTSRTPFPRGLRLPLLVVVGLLLYAGWRLSGNYTRGDTHKEQPQVPPTPPNDDTTTTQLPPVAQDKHRPQSNLYAGIPDARKTLIQKNITGLFSNISYTKSAGTDDPLRPGIDAYNQRAFKNAYVLWDSLSRRNEDYSGYAKHYMAYAALQLAIQLPDPSEQLKYIKTARQLCTEVLSNPDYDQIWPSVRWALTMTWLAEQGGNGVDFQRSLKEIEAVDAYKERVDLLRKQ